MTKNIKDNGNRPTPPKKGEFIGNSYQGANTMKPTAIAKPSTTSTTPSRKNGK